jgi:SAM-dependent methyltransferase
MNGNSTALHPSVHYYDGDYPSPESTAYPENFDEITAAQGLAHDIARYKEIAAATGGPVLELCCGTGRVAIPLAKAGFNVTAVDISEGLISAFRKKLSLEPAKVRKNMKIIQQDITRLSLERRDFKTIIIAFNSLLCVPEFKGQCAALEAIAKHLSPEGRLVLDIVNPLVLKFDADSVPKAFFTRKNPHTGNTYTRFAMRGAFDADHRQRLHGWYDEITPDGTVKRRHYSVYWRPIFRFEIELMLKQAGLRIETLEGGHLKEPYTAQSAHLFIQAVKAQKEKIKC